jgi:hypothetical protein
MKACAIGPYASLADPAGVLGGLHQDPASIGRVGNAPDITRPLQPVEHPRDGPSGESTLRGEPPSGHRPKSVEDVQEDHIGTVQGQ